MPSDEELRALLPIISERLPTLGAIGDLVGFLWVDDLPYDAGPARPEALGRGDDARGAPRPRATTIAEAGRVSLRGRRARAAAPRPGRGARLEGRRPVHGHPRRGHRPDRDAAAVRHARRARASSGRSSGWIGRSWIADGRDREVPDDPRRRPGLARPLHRGLVELRREGDRRPVRRGRRVPLSAVGGPGRRSRRRSSPTGCRDKDEPGTWTAHYDVWAFDGERADAIGESRYTNPDGSFRTLYYNHCALRFDGHGKCVEFIEYFMELPEQLRAGR